MDIVKRYVVKKGLYRPGEIDAVEQEYKRYLALAFAHPHAALPISQKLDDFWHSHILFTQDYTEMCDHVVGYYLHHRPSILDGGVDFAEQFGGITLTLYRAVFGEPDASLWNTAGECCRPCSSDPNGIQKH